MDETNENNIEQEDDERKEGQADALIVFGFGIKDPYWMQKQKEAESTGEATSADDRSTGWMLSLGAKMRVQAATELYLQGAAKEVIFTGGATRGKDEINETEAEVMENYFLHILEKRKREQLSGGMGPSLSITNKRDIENVVNEYINSARSNLIREDKATNTIENFSRTLSMFDDNPDKYKSVAFLSNRFHIARIIQLAGQFGLAGKGFSAEDEISRARSEKRHGSMFSAILDKYLNSEEYAKFTASENRWSRGLREVPEYFLPQTIFVKGERLKKILSLIAKAESVYEAKLKEIGIDPEELDSYSEDELKEKISQIERKLPPEEWATIT